MGEDTRMLVRLGAALARGVVEGEGKPALLDAMDDALEHADPDHVEEVLLQSYLFLGFPAAINALTLWRKRSGRPAPAPAETDPEGWAKRGVEVCGKVYDGHYERLRRAVAELHPDLDRWAVTEGYGKVLGREGLDLVTRELCIVAFLAGLYAPRQLFAHLRGALNVGAAPDDVERTMEWIGEVIGEERIEDAYRVWGKVQERHVVAGD
jgi:4-carboxymuconolactone decarboxylase